jgi:hypothetical protein
VHRDNTFVWPYIVIIRSCDLHRDNMFVWPCIVTIRSCDRTSWQYVQVIVHRDNTFMWPCCIVTIRPCDSASWQYVHVTVLHRDNTSMWPCIVTNFFIIKPTRRTNFTNLFWHETLHVSDSPSAHQQQFIHCTLSDGICHTTFEQDQNRTAVPSWSCSKAVWHIPLLSVQWINCCWWADGLSETCRVSCQNKFVKLVHLVGFIISKYDFCETKKIMQRVLKMS